MQVFIAYALVAVGIPIFIGNILGILLSMPISLVVGISRGGKETPVEVSKAETEAFKWSFKGKVEMDLRDRIAHTCYDLFSGLSAVFIAGLIFYLLRTSPSIIIILLIIIAWEIFPIINKKKSSRILFGQILGIVIGYFVIIWIFTF